MNKKGFTLIELLSVIIILFLLVILVLPNITNAVKNNQEKTDALMLEMIIDAGDLYVRDNESDFPEINGNTYCVTLIELIDYDYLKSPVNYDGNDISSTKSLEVTYSDGYKFELVDKNLCIEKR